MAVPQIHFDQEFPVCCWHGFVLRNPEEKLAGGSLPPTIPTGWTSPCKLFDMSGNLISHASYPKHCCIQSHERQFWSLGNGQDSPEELRALPWAFGVIISTFSLPRQ